MISNPIIVKHTTF